jgi:hypothetical protein
MPTACAISIANVQPIFHGGELKAKKRAVATYDQAGRHA